MEEQVQQRILQEEELKKFINNLDDKTLCTQCIFEKMDMNEELNVINTKGNNGYKEVANSALSTISINPDIINECQVCSDIDITNILRNDLGLKPIEEFKDFNNKSYLNIIILILIIGIITIIGIHLYCRFNKKICSYDLISYLLNKL
jgi:hypothetical protein